MSATLADPLGQSLITAGGETGRLVAAFEGQTPRLDRWRLCRRASRLL
jgi:hypothetical protein